MPADESEEGVSLGEDGVPLGENGRFPTGKMPSRSARRKKLKRQLRREGKLPLTKSTDNKRLLP